MTIRGPGSRSARSFTTCLVRRAGLGAVVWLAGQAMANAQVSTQNLGEVTAEVLDFGTVDSCKAPTTQAALLDEDPQAAFEQGKIGEQLAGICLPSAVASGPSFGVSVGLRPARSVTQYRLASARLNKRLAPKKRRSQLDRPILLASNGPVRIGDVGDTVGGWSVFGAVDYEDREQEQSHFDPGYSADLVEVTLGLDKTLSSSIAVGFMLNYVDRSGDFARTGLLNAGFSDYTGTDLQSDADVLAVCGLIPGGDFKQDGWGGSVFIGFQSAGHWFARAVATYSAPDHEYRRQVCGIETVAADSGAADTEDVFAGSLLAKSKARELGLDLRIGSTLNFGGWLLRPEAALTAERSELDGYQEVGRASKTSYLCPQSQVDDSNPTQCTSFGNPQALVIREGQATGLEIRVPDQEADSVQGSLGLNLSKDFLTGSFMVSPHIGATYVHEFANDARDVQFQFAQDLRGAQARTYAFRTGDPDRDFGWVNAGLSFVAPNGAELDIEARKLVADERYDAWGVNALARWRF